MLKSDVYIPKERQKFAFQAIVDLLKDRLSRPVAHSPFAFVETARLGKACDLLEALGALRWIPETDEAGNIVSLEFTGEKLGDEEQIFRAIAACVKEGSAIQMAGEEGNVWRWLFKEETVVCQNGEIVFH